MDRSIYDSDLDWWFGCGASVLGERSTLISTTSALERGNAISGAYEEPFGNLKLHDWHETIDKERRCRARFLKLTKEHQALLAAHYSTLGAKTAFMAATFGELAGAMIVLANVDLLGPKTPKSEIDRLERLAMSSLKEACDR